MLADVDEARFEWRERPWYDDCPATFRHAWETILLALRCWFLGHGGTEYPSEHMDRAWRTCNRCGRKWERYRRR